MKPFTVAPSVASRVPPQSAAEIFRPKVYYRVLVVFLSFLTVVALTTVNLPDIATAAEPSKTEAAMEDRGDIFIATLMPTGRFGAMVASAVTTIGFVQFQMDKEGKLNLLRLSTEDGQAYEFRRE